MSVPKTAADMKNADNYKVGTVNSCSYVVRENGSSRDFVVGQGCGPIGRICIACLLYTSR